ncbi:hypothetical protein AAHE18_14G124700 [Arachis hypogaea]|uniref:Uncharacterized protein n=1 Tax=Arachis hypogaea TaxID=3818 RepID=A0A444ZN56_ARAHY|nr:hypothetical protein Ahy_B04g072501 [Arachis hypogaea]
MEVVEETVVKVEESQAEEEDDDATISKVLRWLYCTRTFYSSQALGGTKMLTEKREEPRKDTERASAEYSYLLFASSLSTPPKVFPSAFITGHATNLAYFPSRHISEGFRSNGAHEFAGDNGVFPYRLSVLMREVSVIGKAALEAVASTVLTHLNKYH